MLKFLTTWTVLILLLILLAKSKWGKSLLYWLLWLALALLLVTHGDELASLIDVKDLQING